MPEEEYAWLPREDILSFEEMARLVDVFADLGVDKVRLTGGEPLLRKDLHRLVAMLAADRVSTIWPSPPTGCCSASRRRRFARRGFTASP